jgi:hypothetical protein
MLKSIKKTIRLIKKNKNKILFLFFLQLLFFIALSTAVYYTLSPAMFHAKNALDYYDSINISDSPGRFDYLGGDPLIVYNSYNKMIHYLKLMGLFSLLCFLVFEGLLWLFTDNLLHKKTIKQAQKYLTKFALFTLAYLAISFIIVQANASSLADPQSSYPLLILIWIFSVILEYFLFILYSLNTKRTVKETAILAFKIGTKRFLHVFLIYVMCSALLLLLALLLFLSIEAHVILLSLSLLLFVFSFVVIRLFLIVAFNESAKNNVL